MESSGKVTSYAYDDLGRLTSESIKLTPTGSVSQRYTYTYDDYGNRATLTATGAKAYTTAYTYNKANQLTSEARTQGGTTSATTYTYDGNGNQLTKNTGIAATTITNQYTTSNELLKTTINGTTVQYRYNPSGLRTGKIVNGTIRGYVLDGENVVLETMDGSVVDNYVYGVNLISRDGNSYYLHNGHGDVTYLTNASGAVTKTYTYDAFGNEENPVSTDANPFRYAGEYYDKETGTYYLRARYYDPVIGRFLREDPARHSTNWYLYCYCNPVRYADPSGEIPVDTIIDLASLGWSISDFVANPNLTTFGLLAWDALAVIAPYIPGSYVTKTLKAGTQILTKADNYVKSGVWTMKHFERGYEIERALGGWANNFPTIDWAKQIITGPNTGLLKDIKSIKSLDLTAKRYKNSYTLKKTLYEYIDELATFKEAGYKGITWKFVEGSSKTLEIAVPPVEITAKQLKVFKEVETEAAAAGIELVITIVS